MSCKICGRFDCSESFHSIKEQEAHERYSDLSKNELIAELLDRDSTILDLKEKEKEKENE